MHRCFRLKLLWSLLYQHRVLEAVLATPRIALERADARLLHEIGVHARDVLNRIAGQCQTLQIVLDLVRPTLPKLISHLDPWLPPLPELVPPLPPFTDPAPLLEIALGGALLALRAEFPMPNVEIRDAVEERGDAVIEQGATVAVQAGLAAVQSSLDRLADITAP